MPGTSPHRPGDSLSPPDEDAISRDTGESLEVIGSESSLLSVPRSFQEHSFSNYYRRPSVAASARPTVVAGSLEPNSQQLSQTEHERLIREERSLLKDNNLLKPSSSSHGVRPAPDHPPKKSEIWKSKNVPDHGLDIEADAQPASESTPLLGNIFSRKSSRNDNEIEQRWEDAVMAGKIKTTWQRETKVLARNSAPLIATFILQYSLTVASIFTIGHIGKTELGAVSLASMTASITGYSVYHGLATSLDTLCAQAYGSGARTLVGVQLQRMVAFLWCVTIPIAIIWFYSGSILAMIVPETETAHLAGLYLRISILGLPGYFMFESAKRYVQAQGLFDATLYCLLFCAPLNAIMNYVFVWKLGWGFVGAPIAVVITDTLLPICLFSYVYFIDGRDCWGGFSKSAFQNWWPMIQLALPGLVMVMAEYLAFEILTLASSYISPAHLAANSVLSTIAALTFQVPFPLGIAASTRIANLIGATLEDAGKVAARVAIVGAVIIGVFNSTLLFSLRHIIPKLFTSDADVVAIVQATIPIIVAFQMFDALATVSNGILRGIGRQDFGGIVNLVTYYAIGMPISFGFGFGAHWDLIGLWAGPALSLGLVSMLNGTFVMKTSWKRAVDEAQKRNAMG